MRPLPVDGIRMHVQCNDGTAMRYHEMPMQTVYAKTLGELIEEDRNVLCLEADLAKASGTIPDISDKLSRAFHRRGRFARRT